MNINMELDKDGAYITVASVEGGLKTRLSTTRVDAERLARYILKCLDNEQALLGLSTEALTDHDWTYDKETTTIYCKKCMNAIRKVGKDSGCPGAEIKA